MLEGLEGICPNTFKCTSVANVELTVANVQSIYGCTFCFGIWGQVVSVDAYHRCSINQAYCWKEIGQEQQSLITQYILLKFLQKLPCMQGIQFSYAVP